MGLSVHDPFVDPLGNPLGLQRAGADISPVGTITTRTTGPAANEMEADGRQLLKADYSKLYAAIGDAYSIADFSGGFSGVTLPADGQRTAIAWGKGIFIAISTTGITAVSADNGATWQAGATLPAGNWRAITFGNGIFVAIAAAGGAAISSNGSSWTPQTLPAASTNWAHIAFGKNTFVAVAATGNVAATSSDGITWTQRAMPATTGWSRVAYGGGAFVAFTNSTSAIAAYSSDGITWIQTVLPASGSWIHIAYGSGRFIAAPSSDSIVCAISTNGINWIAGPPATSVVNLVYGAGMFISLSNTTSLLRCSPDGVTWSAVAVGLSTRTYAALAFADGTLIGLATNANESLRGKITSATNFNIPALTPIDGLSTAYIKVA